MPHRYDDRDERNRGEFSGGLGPQARTFGPRNRARNPNDFFNEDADFGGPYARDTHRGGFGDDYARESRWGGTGAPGDYFGSWGTRNEVSVGYGPGQTRSMFGRGGYGGWARAYGENDAAGRASFRGRGPKNWRRNDDAIREEINDRLTDHHDIDASDIEVDVRDGEVTLRGAVDDRRTKRLAEDLCYDCRGVRDVHNQLRVNENVHIGKASE